MCRTSVHRYKKAFWINRKLPEGYTIKNISDLSDTEIDTVDQLRKKKSFPVELDPFQLPETRIQELCLFLFRSGNLIGWWISHRAPNNEVQRTALFILPNERNLNLSLAFSALGVMKQMQLGVDGFQFQFSLVETGQRRFYEHYLKQLQEETTYIYQATKSTSKSE